ncbi:MAG: hypothetical protein EOO27_15015 [Comamonadaceae bacterium]|nr:MAG: hypothetical protein EOO27_15015 [Comamonadaceae bacterium]
MTHPSALERADRLPATSAHNPTHTFPRETLRAVVAFVRGDLDTPHTIGRDARSPVVPLIAVAAAAPTAAFTAVVARSVTTGALIALLMFAAVILAARMI